MQAEGRTELFYLGTYLPWVRRCFFHFPQFRKAGGQASQVLLVLNKMLIGGLGAAIRGLGRSDALY